MDFKKPWYFTETKKYKLTLALVSSLFVYIFLLFFQPFGINNYRPDEHISLVLVLILFLMAVLIFVAILLNEMLLRPKIRASVRPIPFMSWMIWEVVIVCTVTFLFYNYMGGFHDFYLHSYLKHILEIGVVLIFPFAGTIFYFKHTTVVRDYQEIVSVNNETPVLNEVVTLSGDYKKDQIGLPLNSIVFIQSEDNYASLHYLEEDRLKKYLIRSTLTNLEKKLNSDWIFRCNRAVMVNLYHLEFYKYESGTLVLSLKYTDQTFSVSKSRRSEIASALEKHTDQGK